MPILEYDKNKNTSKQASPPQVKEEKVSVKCKGLISFVISIAMFLPLISAFSLAYWLKMPNMFIIAKVSSNMSGSIDIELTKSNWMNKQAFGESEINLEGELRLCGKNMKGIM